MVGSPEEGLRAEFYRRLLLGFFAALLFIAAVRIFCELALKAHVKAGTFKGRVAVEKKSYGTIPVEKRQDVPANYGNDDLFTESKQEIVEENQGSQSYQEIN